MQILITVGYLPVVKIDWKQKGICIQIYEADNGNVLVKVNLANVVDIKSETPVMLARFAYAHICSSFVDRAATIMVAIKL